MPRLKMKTLALAAVTSLTAIAGGDRAAQAVEAIPVLLCPFGCGPMAGDTILMNQLIQAQSDVMILPQETPGYNYNIREMALNESKRKTSIFATEDTLIQVAYQGGQGSMAEFLPEPVQIPWKLLYGEAWWGQGKFLATFDCSLKTMADLKGKRISLGLRGQSDWGVFSRLFLEYGYGVTPENTDIRHMTPGQLTQQLIDGATDAAVTPIGAEPTLTNFLIPGPVRQLEATGKKICYLGVTKEIVDKLNKEFDATWIHVTLPPNTLPHQDEPLGVGFNRAYKAAHEDFSEETAYKLVKAVAEIGPKMKELHALWNIWNPELMTCGLSEENAHPGAIRAFKELGWWELTEKCDPMTYPEVK
ncbi:TAXI family TRAP transporter solute-binding subunit [Roseobacter sp. AzwK-3b]|uniref:TAXI family TRAP transporter solute-binding subunit n=1 Tax=Roseobacter sp. AzwK-3b TaxID=351016 RepID=UPI000A05823F|nr:TAXI family TRAP transporter solute-binding subunit [Roseobacter sp. AzwK-3b]